MYEYKAHAADHWSAEQGDYPSHLLVVSSQAVKEGREEQGWAAPVTGALLPPQDQTGPEVLDQLPHVEPSFLYEYEAPMPTLHYETHWVTLPKHAMSVWPTSQGYCENKIGRSRAIYSILNSLWVRLGYKSSKQKLKIFHLFFKLANSSVPTVFLINLHKALTLITILLPLQEP